MNKGVATFIGFVIGGAVGFFGAGKLLEEKYRRISQEEIDSVKEVYGRKHGKYQKQDAAKPDDNHIQENSLGGKAREASAYTKYDKTVKDLGYSKPTPPKIDRSKPYIITPDEFNHNDDYETISLTYYADGTLADEDDVKMTTDEIRSSVGLASLGHFGEYEADSVFVRNEALKTDYEILMDSRSYSDILKERPYLQEE